MTASTSYLKSEVIHTVSQSPNGKTREREELLLSKIDALLGGEDAKAVLTGLTTAKVEPFDVGQRPQAEVATDVVQAQARQALAFINDRLGRSSCKPAEDGGCASCSGCS